MLLGSPVAQEFQACNFVTEGWMLLALFYRCETLSVVLTGQEEGKPRKDSSWSLLDASKSVKFSGTPLAMRPTCLTFQYSAAVAREKTSAKSFQRTGQHATLRDRLAWAYGAGSQKELSTWAQLPQAEITKRVQGGFFCLVGWFVFFCCCFC